jgi:hypothetical protein
LDGWLGKLEEQTLDFRIVCLPPAYSFRAMLTIRELTIDFAPHPTRELPDEVKQVVGSVPDGYLDYFRSKFPRLIVECHGYVKVKSGPRNPRPWLPPKPPDYAMQF